MLAYADTRFVHDGIWQGTSGTVMGFNVMFSGKEEWNQENAYLL
jgi:hypothetical protein